MMVERFIKKEHYLDYDVKHSQNIKLGFTTRENGLSLYPEYAFNMARYVDDNQDNITEHQKMLASDIGFDRKTGYFLYKLMKIKSLKSHKIIKGKY